MKSSDIYYERFIREADRINRDSLCTDVDASLKDIKRRITKYKLNPLFYYNCGIAVMNVLHSVQSDIDEIKIAMGGLSKFESLIGKDDNKLGDAYDKQVTKPVKELKTYTDSYDDTYLLSAACPNCNHKLTLISDYCPNCGQHLAWDKNKKIVDDEKSVSEGENA